MREVYRELTNRNVPEWLLDWAKENRQIFLTPGEGETEFVNEIFRVPHFRGLVSERQRLQGRPVADPFVIACAQVRQGSVVTQEKGPPNAARIPNVCDHFGIRCIDFEGFLVDMDWSY